MILGIGIDQCEVGRMRRQLEADPDGFVAAVFLPAEISYCNAKRHPAELFAARFAAKEAAIKALAAAEGQGTFWHDLEVTNEHGGGPALALSGRLRQLADALGVRTMHVSLTHTADQAAAVVIAEG
jgi:holo-[acyl-carrier protein] synthase